MILNFLTMKAKSVIFHTVIASSSTMRTWLQESDSRILRLCSNEA